MQSITWPSGLERPAVPTARRGLPQPHTIRPRHHDVLHRAEQERVRPSQLIAWCVGGSIGWAALIGAGWLLVNLVGHLP